MIRALQRAVSRRALNAAAAFTAISLMVVPANAKEVVRALVNGQCNTPSTPFCDSVIPAPAAWKGPFFKLSQNYPQAIPPDAQPWLQFDPKTQSLQYMLAVLEYFYDGNLQQSAEASFDPTLNARRGWYNAPWQDVGLNGREPIHGLTRERVSRPRELHPSQSKLWNNYAIGFYNAPGGYVIGKIWGNHGNPDAAAASMPAGTVAAKLLFTTATPAEVPFLAGAPEWSAYVFANPNDPAPKLNSPRAVLKVRLLQIDLAVKDPRLADTTGWVFGTFVYGGGPGGAPGTGWQNVAPVGLMWGNDPGYSGTGPLTQTSLNPRVTMPHVGYQGRLNGPVDNPASSCMSCHSTAEVPRGDMMPPAGTDPARWFQNIPSGTAFDSGRQATDYSLQVSVGIANFMSQRAADVASMAQGRKRLMQFDSQPPRDGGQTH